MSALCNGTTNHQVNGVVGKASQRKFRIPDLIMKKRDGEELTKEEIDYFIGCVCDPNNNAIQESQIGAMLMAIYHKNMTYDESFNLTRAMMDSGARFNWPKHKGCVVDKHSTGGVGDKISLPLAPALAACGLKVPMISGRGLGFTGGTLDKLESIPGFQVNCSKERIESLIDTVGCCIVGQTAELNPADRILYATRDVTSTVECIPLIAGSIVSKKAIEDLDALILDVKLGKAAFMKNQADAELLADYMLQICRKLNFKAGVFLTRHDDPLGKCIGNQLEIEETIECLHGNSPWDIEELVTKYGGYLLSRTDKAYTMSEGAKMIQEKLRNGEALKIFYEMIVAQGVSEELAKELCYNRNYAKVFKSKAKHVTQIKSKNSGFIKSIDALRLGFMASKLGAGRIKANDQIFYEVGFRLLKTIGDQINNDEAWLQVEHNNADLDPKMLEELTKSLTVSNEPVKRESVIVKIIDFN